MSAIENTPEISFIDNKTVEDVRGEMVADYEDYMTQAQGVAVSLDRASVPPHDPVRRGGADLPGYAVHRPAGASKAY